LLTEFSPLLVIIYAAINPIEQAGEFTISFVFQPGCIFYAVKSREEDYEDANIFAA